MWIYVVGHELTHAVWVWLFGGSVKKFKATSNGGHVIVDTLAGRGTVFRILLPPSEAVEEVPASAVANGAGSHAPRTRLRGRVLVVDDEPSVAEFMGELLSSWGLEASVAVEPEVALAMLRVDAEGYDLVITDETMPRMSGLQLAMEIGRSPSAPPVVLYTGYAEGVVPAEFAASGVKGLVRKPLDLRELHAVISRHLERIGPEE